ncbi:hypothetical protein EUTSA_v10024172mg [Eutrema salsugineum]|uniref:Uncharacterized protein n=1 Tax=Eutrema salsugineum TaxID=72664 RepID=V4KEU5_EUTSA|nr:hypothetical protein EUTSA_v10024172mg [Eutrema salsugineum]
MCFIYVYIYWACSAHERCRQRQRHKKQYSFVVWNARLWRVMQPELKLTDATARNGSLEILAAVATYLSN